MNAMLVTPKKFGGIPSRETSYGSLNTNSEAVNFCLPLTSFKSQKEDSKTMS